MHPVPEDWQSLVAVAAHPDDLEYGAAAAIARWTGQGKRVSYVIATTGEAGIKGMPPAKAGPLRAQEQRRSAAKAGVADVRFLDYQDGLIEYGLPLRRDLAAAFRSLRPDVVLTMSFDLTWGEGGPVNHADHRVVGLAALDACRDAANEWIFPDSGPPHTGIVSAYVAGVNEPTHFVDVTSTIDTGIASLREHSEYIRALGTSFDPDQFLRDMTGYIGLGAGCDYAVGMTCYPMR